MIQQSDPLTVVHSLPLWLPLTSPWLFNQVRLLPPEVRSHIVCARTNNLDQFDIPNLHSLNREPHWRWYWDMGLRKLRIRDHLAYLVDVGKRYCSNIVHSHWGTTGWGDIGAVRRLGTYHVVSFYGKEVDYLPEKDPVWRRRYKELWRHVDLVLCEGPHMARSIVDLGCPEGRVQVQRLGVEVERIAFRPRIWKTGEILRILIAASFREKKGITYALAALGELQAELPQIEITIIGDSSEDPRSHIEKAKILGIIKKYSLHEKVRMLGYQPYSVLLEEAYRHHVFMSPSVTAGDGDTEGGAPVTLIDMAASGIPIVSTSHCDIPSVILHDKTGLLAPERDVQGLLTHLRWLIDHPKGWTKMVVDGRHHIEMEFDARKQATKLYDLYRSL